MPAVKRPTELKLLEGRKVSGEPLALRPLDEWRVPTTLRRHGKALWRRVCEGYRGTKVLQVTDRPALELLCMTHDLVHEAAADIRKRGHLVPSARGDGDMIRNPSVLVLNSASERWHRLAASFGLSPADRARLDSPKVEPEENPLDAIIREAVAGRAASRAARKG